MPGHKKHIKDKVQRSKSFLFSTYYVPAVSIHRSNCVVTSLSLCSLVDESGDHNQPPSIPPAAAATVTVAAAPPALHRLLSQRDHSVLAADIAAAVLFTPPQLSLRQGFSRSAPTLSLLPPRRQRRRIRAANAAASKSSTVCVVARAKTTIEDSPLTLT